MTEDIVGWLVSEINDLLDVSSVGLYEFIWLLRSGQPGIDDDERQVIASRALRQLFSSEPVKLILLTWPNADSEGEVSLKAVSSSDWDDPPENRPYVALIRESVPQQHG
jgi:hypothetical protein